MARYRPQRQHRINVLLRYGMTKVEAKMLSLLSLKNDTVKAIVRDRVERYNHFTVTASRKMSQGKWRSDQFMDKWLANLHRMYRKNGWLVQGKYSKHQVRRPVGAVNPWAMFRSYEKEYPDKGHVSPWEVKRSRTKRALDWGQIFLQRAASGSTRQRVEDWIGQLNDTIQRTSSPLERARIRGQRDRLRSML